MLTSRGSYLFLTSGLEKSVPFVPAPRIWAGYCPRPGCFGPRWIWDVVYDPVRTPFKKNMYGMHIRIVSPGKYPLSTPDPQRWRVSLYPVPVVICHYPNKQGDRMAAAQEHCEFKTEIKKLLDIITNSLYTNREIFMRELISNASDALDKLRFETSRGTVVQDADLPLEITIEGDEKASTLTLKDTGIGMSRDEIVQYLGTIANSGSEKFLESMAKESTENKDASEIIGRFGVGF